MNLLIISSSLNPNSKSRKLAQAALAHAQSLGIGSDYLDLQNHHLSLCDGAIAFSQPGLSEIQSKLQNASSIVLSGPIYTYGMASSTKNLIELTGRLWAGKPVGLMAAAGGKHSYMAVLGIANSLMLDYRCPIVPRYVYADPSAFDLETGNLSDEISSRIVELVKTVSHWAAVL